MTNQNSGQFSARDSLIGYLYQVRTALLWALQKLPAGADFLVSIETLDDVTFDTKDGAAKELLQTKHQLVRTASLTDASSDLWKTLRVWVDVYVNGRVGTETALHLLTTGIAPTGSAASYLRIANRNIDAALNALIATAQTSTNQDNAAAYHAFLGISHATQKAILSSVVILDSAPNIEDLDTGLRNAVFAAVERHHLESFLERLEGWWLRRIVKQLTTSEDRILADELEAQMAELREQFKQDSLPVDEDLINFTLDDATRETHADSVFVRQVELAKAGRARIFSAVRDYYRAFEQRSRWIREDLLMVGELAKYERRLIEEWELVFAAMQDKCGKPETEDAKEKYARDLLQWAEQTAPINFPIRPRVTEAFVARGSLHMLADKLQVGWHLEFRDRLSSLLEAEGLLK